LLAITKHQAQSTTHYFPTFDGNGNVSEYLTASGSIAAHYEYDPFGRTIVAGGPHVADFAYRFSTKPVDHATGLYYYGYRWYDPYTGRWPSRDPIEERGGVNLYGFVGNDGVGSLDAAGLSPVRISEYFTFNQTQVDDFASKGFEAVFTPNQSVKSLQEVVDRVKKVVGEDREKRCLSNLVIWAHGGPGNIEFTDEKGLNNSAFKTYETYQKMVELGKDPADLGLAALEEVESILLLKVLRCYFCPDAKVVINSCNSGKDEAGKVFEKNLSDLLGVPIDLPAAYARPTFGGGIEYRSTLGPNGVLTDREGNPLPEAKPQPACKKVKK
jgi:RHS repeat-associated protein